MTSVRKGALVCPAMPPLDGILVADFSRVLAGPLAAMLLGDLGADVVKVERPDGGDDTRAWGPPWTDAGAASYYVGLNRNKRSVTIDLNDPEDRELAVRLANRADIVVENFRPGTLARFGLDYESVRERNPGSIYVSITAFGSAPQAASWPSTPTGTSRAISPARCGTTDST